MKMKKSLLSRVLIATIIISVLVSCFVISSSASSTDVISVPDSYYTFIPKNAIGTNFISIFDGRFYAGAYPDSFRSVIVSGSAERGTYYSFDPGGVPIDICHVSPSGVVTWSDVALSYTMWHIVLPAQDVIRQSYNFLESFCILGAGPGTYFINSVHVFNNITYSYQWDVSAVLDGDDGPSEGIYLSVSLADGTYRSSNGYIYYTNLLYFEDRVAFSSFEGFVNGWDGSINLLTPLFFDSPAEMLAFYSTFESSVSSPGGQFSDGFEKGKQAGIAYAEEYLKPEWEEAAKQEGIEEGRNYTASENLGSNLLGDTISAPFEALDNFVIYGSISLLDVLGACISLSLLIAFLKMFAGG